MAKCKNCNATLGMRRVDLSTEEQIKSPTDDGWRRTHPKGKKQECDRLLRLKQQDRLKAQTVTTYDPRLKKMIVSNPYA